MKIDKEQLKAQMISNNDFKLRNVRYPKSHQMS